MAARPLPRRPLPTSRFLHRGAGFRAPGDALRPNTAEAAFDGSTSKEIHESSTKKSATRWLGAAAPALVAWSLTSGMAQAATPAAGTIISNQAAASYTDGQGVDRVSQSNAVETLVLPKAAFSLASDNTSRPRRDPPCTSRTR